MSHSHRPRQPHNAHSGPVPSPCTAVCRMSPATGWCEGCQRTLDEIASWSRLSDPQKRAVWAELAQRRATLAP